MKFLPLLFLLFLNTLSAQQVIDASFDFQSEEDKSYHIYIPSSYDETVPNTLMLALHPLNTNRWDGRAWRDTLMNFAESNSLILLSPDGGEDGKIDDPIDTAFISLVLDSMSHWYAVDKTEQYIMGFSWGGKTAYTYGLNNHNKFKGFMPIGAAVDINEVSAIMSNANQQSFYLVHGENDSPNSRYTPLLEALENNNACVESILMNNVGHTIDFPNRNEILTDAFQYLKSSSCTVSNQEDIIQTNRPFVFPNPNEGIFTLNNLGDLIIESIDIFTLGGEKVKYIESGNKIQLIDPLSGMYFLRVSTATKQYIQKLIIHN